MFNRVKGTQDFLDLKLYNFIIDSIKKHLKLYNFNQIITPILEPTELFKRGLGVQTDVVNKEMFTINTDPESESICLRPEVTASVVRAFIENGVQQTPWKVFVYGPMFRYERPQKGRYREFNQIDMEIIGSNSMAQDALFIAMLDRFFHEKLGINSFALLLNFIGCFEDRAAYKLVLKEYLDSETAKNIDELCKTRKETNILRIFDCKNPICQEIYANAPYITDYLCKPCAADWQELRDELDMLSISYAHKPTLVRGLDYYNKTVFEFTSDNLGAQNAFCGGGRYDSLVAQLGGKEDRPSVGCAIGLERVMLLLDSVQDQLQLPELPALHVIVPIAPAQKALALLIADQLQSADLCVEVLLEGDSMKSMMRHANKLAAKFCIIIGDEEQATHSVTVKNMITGESQKIKQIELVGYLRK